MSKIINIIEPTLSGISGHCHTFIASLCDADPTRSCQFNLWVARNAEVTHLLRDNVQVNLHFARRIRRIQCFFLYRRLLEASGRIFLSTATRTDLMLLDLASRGSIHADKVYLYFHWFRRTDSKLRYLKRIALHHPHLHFLGPTVSAVEAFKESGIKNVRVVPYPITAVEASVAASGAASTGFTHLLFAGAARSDKGFCHVVDLISYLSSKGIDIPFTVQASPDHYGKHDQAAKQALSLLQSSSYPSLRLCPEALERSAYFSMYSGAICLQLYNREDFADRISGITLDALSMGCPVVCSSGTWISKTVERFDAGISIESFDPEEIWSAVSSIMSNYEGYRRSALEAGRILQGEHTARQLLDALTEGAGPVSI